MYLYYSPFSYLMVLKLQDEAPFDLVFYFTDIKGGGESASPTCLVCDKKVYVEMVKLVMVESNILLLHNGAVHD